MGQLGLKRDRVSKHRVSLAGADRRCHRLFLDSGAHSLYMKHARPILGGSRQYRYYSLDGKTLTKRFRKYLDTYAAFVLKHKDVLDVYASVDVIFNPELSWTSLKYLEDKGLKPLPVVHDGTPLEWTVKYVESGYKYLGVGGVGQESSRKAYVGWADQLFKEICPPPSRLPVVKVHGFAVTSVPFMLRWPWWSVDSSRWAKAAGYGSILVPYKNHGAGTGFRIDRPFLVCFSHRRESLQVTGPHISKLPPIARKNVLDWLDEIDMPLGKTDDSEKPVEYGVSSQYHARATANLKYFERLERAIPKWPWPFKTLVARGLHE